MSLFLWRLAVVLKEPHPNQTCNYQSKFAICRLRTGAYFLIEVTEKHI